MAVQPTTNMVAGLVPRPARNDSTVVTAWPAAIDVKNDIFMNQCSVFIFVRLFVCSFMFVYVRLRSFTSAPPPVCCVHKHSPFTNVRLRSFTCSGRCEHRTWGCSKTPVWERVTWAVFKNTGFGDVEIITLELNHLMCGVWSCMGQGPIRCKDSV